MLLLGMMHMVQAAASVALAQRLQAMFDHMVVAKDIKQMPRYYNRDFVLYSNGSRMSYQQFYQLHAKVYRSGVRYKLKFDRNTLVERGSRVALQLMIWYKPLHKAWKKIQVIMIARYKKHKISRIWEKTSPSWQRQKFFLM